MKSDAHDPAVSLLEYRADLACDFYTINAAWISSMFVLEPHDEAVLRDPQHHIIDRGGEILFAHDRRLGVVGTCALMPTAGGGIELTKMGVVEAARGRRIGEFLLRAALGRALAISADPLYLLTSSKCVAAIHVYLKNGFVHDPEIMARYGATYARCDVAMRFVKHAR